MFDKYKTIKRFRNDAAKIKFSETDMENGKIEIKSRPTCATVVRFAACSVVAAAVVLTGMVWVPKSAQSSKKTNCFEIVACAAGVPSGKVLTANQKIKLSAGVNSSSSSNEPTSRIAISGKITDCFKVDGNNIKTITYTTSGQRLFFISDSLVKQAKAIKKYCIIKIAKSEFKTSDLSAEFEKMWANGKLDEYKDKYFNGKDIDESVYNVGFQYDENYVTAIITKSANIDLSENGNFSEGNTFTINSNKQDNIGVWFTDSSGQIVKDTTINVKVTFNDGSTQTKTVGIELDSIGLPYLTLKK